MACGGGSTKVNGGTLMRQGCHKAGGPGLGWHGDSWGLVWPHSSNVGGMVGMEGRRLGRAWGKYSGKLGKPKQFALPFTTRQEKPKEIKFQTQNTNPTSRLPCIC